MTSIGRAHHPGPVAAPPGRPDCTPVVVFSCHGGAGTSTLVEQLGADAHEAGPIHPAILVAAAGRAVIVVARATATGSRLAVEATAVLRGAGATSIVVAVVGDGPWPEPLAARARLRALSGHVPVIRVPYVARWRFEDPPSTVPARYERAVTRLRAAYCRCTHHDVPAAT